MDTSVYFPHETSVTVRPVKCAPLVAEYYVIIYRSTLNLFTV